MNGVILFAHAAGDNRKASGAKKERTCFRMSSNLIDVVRGKV